MAKRTRPLLSLKIADNFEIKVERDHWRKEPTWQIVFVTGTHFKMGSVFPVKFKSSKDAKDIAYEIEEMIGEGIEDGWAFIR